MIVERKHTEAINQITGIVRKHQLTPEQYRYVIKRVREDMRLQVTRSSKVLPDYLTASEVYVLLDKAKDKPKEALLLEFLIFTGLRIAECANLQVEHINFTSGVLKVVQGKGSKDRFVPITTNLQSKILLYLGERRKGYLFAKANLTPYTTRALQYVVVGWLKTLESPKKLTTHSLRHTFACLCLSRGLDIYKIRDLMGHTTVKTTEIYGKMELGATKDEFMRLMDMRG